MNIVIVESPAKCKTINKYLGSGYKVLASFGHIRDLPSKDGSVLPEEDFAMKYEISKNSSKAVKQISDAVKGADSLILATDPDREGEAISWHVLEVLKAKKAIRKDTRVQRVVFNSITKKAILDAMENPRDIDMALVNSQQARRALDYLVGFSISPVLWRKLPGSRSAGRVQSVALRLICDREEEIEAFISREYWDVKADFAKADGKTFNARLSHLNGEKLDKFALPDEAKAKEAVKIIEDTPYKIIEVEKKQVKRKPAAPFITSTLQQEASRKLGFGAKKTMMTAQKLYEEGFITYMRTDSVTVVPEAVMATRNVIEKEYGKEYLPDSPRMYKAKAANTQEAHEAIRPTDTSRKPATLAQLEKDQLRLYELIWKRMVASQMKEAVLDQVAADISNKSGTAILRANGSTINFDGFYALYMEGRDDEDDEEEGRKLPPLEKGEEVSLQNLLPAQHFTEPPPRFSEASLVKRLEELGIGRPSTYASIISILQDREYVRLDKKRFIPEARGRVVTSFLANFFNRYVEYDFTAHLEEELDEISEGKINWKEVLREFWGDFSSNVERAKELDVTSIISELNHSLEHFLFPGEGSLEERRKCPDCAEGRLSLKMGKFGAFLGCSNYPECRHTKQILSAGEEPESTSGGAEEPRELGLNENGEKVFLKKGPYGWYVQLGEEAKPKRTSLQKGMNPENITLEEALGLLSLPREVGTHPETGKKITASIGRYGPYIQHDGKFTSLKAGDDVLNIGINRAVTLIAEAPAKKGAEPLKILGKHPDDEKDVGLYDGRYGPYVKHGKINATLPKTENIDSIDLAAALELLAKKAAAGGKKKKPTRRKKS